MADLNRDQTFALALMDKLPVKEIVLVLLALLAGYGGRAGHDKLSPSPPQVVEKVVPSAATATDALKVQLNHIQALVEQKVETQTLSAGDLKLLADFISQKQLKIPARPDVKPLK